MKTDNKIIVAIVVILLAVIGFAIWAGTVGPNVIEVDDVRKVPLRAPEDTEDFVEDEIDELSCRASGGAWDECGSACRGDETDVCVTVCAEYCECTRDDHCPSGYECDDYVDGTGICVKSV